MREILFRGKEIDNGEWVGGDLFQVPSKNFCAIFEQTLEALNYSVIPETVGQYTGLTDKNCKKIFEGDIVKITDTVVGIERTAVIEFGNPNGVYTWGWQLHSISKEPFAVDILYWVDMEESGAFIEVIGNIHDNPELIGGVENG